VENLDAFTLKLEKFRRCFSWDDVWPLIESSLKDIDIPVYVYMGYHPGQKTEESPN